MLFGIHRIENERFRHQTITYAQALFESLQDKRLTSRFRSALDYCKNEVFSEEAAVRLDKSVLIEFHTEIKKSQRIDAEPYSALLSSPVIDSELSHSKILNQLIAIVLIASSDVRMDEQRCTLALRQLRLMVTGLNSGDERELEAVQSIPSGVGEDTDWLVSLKVLMQSASDIVLRRLRPILRVLEDFNEGGPKNQKLNRNPKKIEGKEVEFVTGRSLSGLSGVKNGKTFDFQRIVSTSTINVDEHRGDQPTFARYYDVDLIAPDAVKQSRDMQNQRAIQIANQHVKQEKWLVSAWEQLTPQEVRVLSRYVVSSKSEDCNVAGLVMLMLITGGTISGLVASISGNKNKIRKIKYVDQQYFLERRLELPEHKQTAANLELVGKSDFSIELPLPIMVSSAIESMQSYACDGVKLSENVDKWLSSINKKEGTRLSQSRIKRYLKDWLINSSKDTPIIEILTGDEVIGHSGLYYCQVQKHRIVDLHNTHIRNLMPGTDLDNRYKDKDKPELIGSKLFVKTKAVEALAEHYKENIDNQVDNRYELEDVHNLITAYTFLMLNLATGHRPVKDPFNTVKSICLITRTVHLQDKDVAGRQSGRVIALPEIAVDQYEAYLSHLKKIQDKYAWSSGELGAYTNDVLSGKGALFFWIESGRPVRFKPSNIHQNIESIFPFKVNWHRHHMRTVLANKLVPPQLIDAWMGHSTFGNETFSTFSGASISQLNLVAEKIQSYLQDDLGLTVIGSRKW